MQNVYTEAMLQPMQKPELYAILVELGIDEGVRKNAPNDEMIALILAKNPPADDSGANDPNTPTETGDNEPKEGDGVNTPPDGENANTGENGADDEGNEPPEDDLPKFTPEQLVKSSTYSHRRDVLRVMLDDDKTYSHAQIAWMMKRFYECKDSTLDAWASSAQSARPALTKAKEGAK